MENFDWIDNLVIDKKGNDLNTDETDKWFDEVLKSLESSEIVS